MTPAVAQRPPLNNRTARVVKAVAWLTPVALIANMVMIAGMGLTTDDPNNVFHPFNRLGYAVDAATLAELVAVGVAVVAMTWFGARGTVVARWSARAALALSIGLVALLAWLIA